MIVSRVGIYVMMVFAAGAFACGSATSTPSTTDAGQQQTQCAPSGTWIFTETRTTGSCSNDVAPASGIGFTLAASGSDYSFTQLDSSGNVVQGITCNGNIDSSCNMHGTCAGSRPMQDSQGNMQTLTINVTYDVLLGSDGHASGKESGNETISGAMTTTTTCDAQFTLSGQRK
jgi:hypothetical protein